MGLPVATLKKGEGRMLKAGGLWIFDNEIAAVTEDAVNGGDVYKVGYQPGGRIPDIY